MPASGAAAAKGNALQRSVLQHGTASLFKCRLQRVRQRQPPAARVRHAVRSRRKAVRNLPKCQQRRGALRGSAMMKDDDAKGIYTKTSS